MYNTETMNNISIEQFAAFLDGNLPEEEMQSVAMAIDANEEYSDILGNVMQVDDTTDVYMAQPELLDMDFLDSDFELPVVPELVMSDDMVELSLAHPEESDTVMVENADVLHDATSDISDEDEVLVHPHVNEDYDLMASNDFDVAPSIDTENELDVLD